jgi:hypothetical protein
VAGLGFKDFANGNILTGDELDGYLMQQSVPRFATTAARDTALLGVMEEGMLAVTRDTNTLWFREDGDWWPLAGNDVANAFQYAHVGTNSPLTSSASAWTTITAWTGDLQAGLAYSAGTWTIQSEGRYLISATILFATNATGVRGVRPVISGVAGQNIFVPTNPTFQACADLNIERYLIQGDTVRLEAFQNSGATINVLGAAVNGNCTSMVLRRVGH